MHIFDRTVLFTKIHAICPKYYVWVEIQQTKCENGLSKVLTVCRMKSENQSSSNLIFVITDSTDDVCVKNLCKMKICP